VLAQSTVDWIWLVPGVTGIGLMALALAAGIASARDAEGAAAERARRRREEGATEAPRAGSSRAGAALAGLRVGLPVAGLAVAALVVLALFVSDHFVRVARTAETPAAAIEAARTAGDLNPWALTPLYLEASSLEAMGRVDEARATLERALALEPRSFATLGLLGDLETRTGDHAAASDLYARAAELNPMDTGLSELARQASRRANPFLQGS
jgi:tetratricopeptide (TPR) repeat protein